jgi:hypothetical protein
MKKIIICLFFSLLTTVGFTQIAPPKYFPTLEEKYLDSVQIDSTPDSTFVLSIYNCSLDSILKNKITFFKTVFKVKDNFKNITINFQSNGHFDYIRITGNIPNGEDVKYLTGIMIIDGFRLFVHNYLGRPIDDYFHKTKSKYLIRRYEDVVMTINTPTWFYVIKNGTLEEIRNE